MKFESVGDQRNPITQDANAASWSRMLGHESRDRPDDTYMMRQAITTAGS